MTISVTDREEGRMQFQHLFQHVVHTHGVVNFDSAGSGATVTEQITVPGAGFGDFCMVALDSDTGGAHIYAHVSAANTVDIHLHNTTGSPLDLAETSFHLICLRS